MSKKNNYRRVKRNKKRREETIINDHSIWYYITIIGCIIIFFCAFYFLTLYLTREERKNNKDDDNTPVSISKTEIIVGRCFDMSDGDYYVLLYDKTDSDISSIYSEILSGYNAKSDKLTIYTVDMGNILNKGFVSESSNTNPLSAEEIKINGPTLMKISNHQVAMYVEGEEGIRNSLS